MPTEPKPRVPIADWDAIELRVNNKVFNTWKNVSITVDMDQSASSFSFSVGKVSADWMDALVPGALVDISIRRYPILHGIIDTRSIKLSGTDATLDISGRDAMGILLDSSIGPGFSVNGKKLKQIAEEVIEPFTADGPRESGPRLCQGSKDSPLDDANGAVHKAQQWLVDHGYLDGAADGIYGPKTKAAVRKFQKDANIQVDGIIWVETWRAMGIDADGPSSLEVFRPEAFIEAYADAVFEQDENTKKWTRVDDPAQDPHYLDYIATYQELAAEQGAYSKKPAAPEPGEKCEGFLKKLAQDKGASIWVDGLGNLTIGDRKWLRETLRQMNKEAGLAEVDLVLYAYADPARSQQNNFKDIQLTHTIEGRFSDYQCYGKVKDKNNDGYCRLARDPTVPLFKPSYQKIDKAEKDTEFALNAMAARDAGLANRYQLSGTAVGFGQRIDGVDVFYEVNRFVKVVIEALRWDEALKDEKNAEDKRGPIIDEEFFISKVTYSLDASGGPQTSLTLKPCAPVGAGLEIEDPYAG